MAPNSSNSAPVNEYRIWISRCETSGTSRGLAAPSANGTSRSSTSTRLSLMRSGSQWLDRINVRWPPAQPESHAEGNGEHDNRQRHAQHLRTDTLGETRAELRPDDAPDQQQHRKHDVDRLGCGRMDQR